MSRKSLLLLVVLGALCYPEASHSKVGYEDHEVRHRLAVSDFYDLGGHVSYGEEARIVYFWVRVSVWHTYVFVNDLEAAIRCLRRMDSFTEIVLVREQAYMASALRRAFPDANVRFSRAGLI